MSCCRDPILDRPGGGAARVAGMAGALAVTAALLASGCAEGARAEPSGGLAIEHPWARPTPPTADAAALYVTIRNESGVDDRLVSASSARCAAVELHLTAMEDGVMSMRPAEPADLSVAPGATLSLEPGGLHVMCRGPASPLVAGELVDLRLRFAAAGTVELSVPVEDR